jgi:hypothetical protein
MILYVNGDSHSAGAELVNNYAFAEDDPLHKHLGRRPHPECIPHSYGYKLAQTLNAGFYLDAESGSSNARILRTTNQFLADNRRQDMIVIIGWSGWDREEWQDGETYYQVSAGGGDLMPEHLQEKYRNWVLEQNMEENDRKQHEWHKKIYELHTTLEDAGINHLFFNTFHNFRVQRQRKYDWNDCFIDPYDVDATYYSWCKSQGYNTVNSKSYHYGRDAHIGWSSYLASRLTKTIEHANIDNTKIVKPMLKVTK